MLIADDGANFIFAPLTNYADYTLVGQRPNAAAPATPSSGCRDGGAHVGFISDGSLPDLPADLLGHATRKEPACRCRS